MTINIDLEVETDFDFDYKEIINKAIIGACTFCNCPFEIEVNVLLTNNEEIKMINKENRDIDKATDVLSFPMIEYDYPGDFSILNQDDLDIFNLETKELILGDIVISCDKVKEQAMEYGHSNVRELAFLTVHSMLHLFGYDHIDEDDKTMEELQEKILLGINIPR